MDKILNELDSTYAIISTISVKGNDVEAMAAARASLKRIYAALKDLNKEETDA